jgi:exosortase
LLVLSLVLWRQPFMRLVHLSLENDQYSYVVLIFGVGIALIVLEWRRLEPVLERRIVLGSGVCLLAAAGQWWLGRHSNGIREDVVLSFSILTLVASWLGAFLLCYGIRAFRTLAFPLLFLVLIVPMPGSLLDPIVHALQEGSAYATYVLFRAAGIPVVRTGFVLSLPGLDIEIARQCSSIRSSLILFATGLVMGHLFLRSAGRKVLLCMVTLPIAVAKNGLRIFTLATLGIYVDPGFLKGRLHQYGRIPFFLLSLALVLLVLGWLRRSEKLSEDRRALRDSSALPRKLSLHKLHVSKLN